MQNLLLKKLLLKAGHKLLLVNAPDNVSEILGEAGTDVLLLSSKGKDIANVILLFARNRKELYKGISAISQNRDHTTILWAIYPKKSGKIPTDLNDMASWNALSGAGLEPVSAAGINEDWTALRLRPQGQSRPSGTCLEDIANNEYGKFIDVKSRIVMMPEDLKIAVARAKEAMTFFEQLAFSNKKEYVLWVLTARQEKTRAGRISQTVEKLLAGRKNPSAK